MLATTTSPAPDGGDALASEARRLTASLDATPLPGRGRTIERWAVLADVASRDLALARLVEGHLDALAILAELGCPPPGGGLLLGVWAARPDALRASRRSDGWLLAGTKPFCSGADLLDAALVTAAADDGARLFLVGADAPRVHEGTWQPLGMAATRSATVSFDDVEVDAEDAVGGPGAYVHRPGFGHGGAGVAACWWGGARAVLDDIARTLRSRTADDPLALAAFAQATLAVDGGASALRDGAAAIDAAPHDIVVADLAAARTRAAVAHAARAVLATAGAHLGTSVLGVDAAVAGRLADLTTYLTQWKDMALVGLGERLLDEPAVGLC